MSAFGKAVGGGRRSAAREEAPLPAVVMTLKSTLEAVVVNISCTGVRLRGRMLPQPEEFVELKIEEIRLFGSVVWREGGECGIGFDSPLMPFEVDRLRRRAGIPALATLSIEERQAVENWLLCVSQ